MELARIVGAAIVGKYICCIAIRCCDNSNPLGGFFGVANFDGDIGH